MRCREDLWLCMCDSVCVWVFFIIFNMPTLLALLEYYYYYHYLYYYYYYYSLQDIIIIIIIIINCKWTFRRFILSIIIQQMPTRQLLTSAIQTQHTRGLQQHQSKRFGHNALLQLFTITINGSSSDGLTSFKNIQDKYLIIY